MSEYPYISKGLGVLTPSMWDRLMEMLRSYEEYNIKKGGSELTIESLHRRISVLENTRNWFFAKLLRANVFDETYQQPNTYKYAWVRVKPKTGDPECCAACLETRDPDANCCNDNCNGGDATIQLQGLCQWEEDTSLSSWGENAYAPTAAAPDADGYIYPAVNLMELFNTANNTAPGTDESNGLGSFQMQAIGGFDTLVEGDPPQTRYEGILNVTPIVVMWVYPESDGTRRYMFQAENSYDGDCSVCS